MYKSFNTPDTLGVISSYPSENGEIARANAISRYTYLLTKNFPKDQKVIVFCETGKFKNPHLEAPNILVVPSYKLNSLTFFKDILAKINKFDAVNSIMIQFEFSIFGGKIIIPQILMLLLTLKLLGKSCKIAFHQVVTDINTLSGHLAIKKDGLKSRLLNFLLRFFYKACGILSEKVFVHDGVLAGRISKLIPGQKIKIIPHGITFEPKISENFRKNSKKYFGVKNETKLIGLFGYCSWYKGSDWLIENFAKFARENPSSNVRLLVAGGESPTLKGTLAYQKYHKRLQRVIKEANGNIIYTGFVPERDVRKVFAATDLFVFPYRTKMSASGAFSLCQGYGKPYMISKAFSENVNKNEAEGRTFSLDYSNFAHALNKNLALNKAVSFGVPATSWESVAQTYLKESLPETETLPKLSYAEAY